MSLAGGGEAISDRRDDKERGDGNAGEVTIAELNASGRDAFVAALGWVFEASPWVAEGAWERHPFAGVDDLLAAMTAVVNGAPLERRVALIAAHPDLAGRLARAGRLTEASRSEQHRAGLDALTEDQFVAFDRLNAAYRERFGFPFVVCVRDRDASAILRELESRVLNERATEIATALREIEQIAGLRLRDAVHE